MYELNTDAKKNIQSYTLSGTIGEIPFNESNIIKGSLSVNNQNSDTSSFRLGGGYIGQLNATFHGLNIDRNDWIGQEIEVSIAIGESTIPVGIFTVDEAKHTNSLVSVTAYDNMAKFDRMCGSEEGTNGLPYDLLSLACEECHVDFGMTQAEVEALPNGNKYLVLNTKGDIETWRDFIYWVSVSLCSFSTIDRNGELVLRDFHDSVDDSLDYDIRINTSTYSDEIITYTGINIYIEEDKMVEYYHAGIDDGYTLNIGNNPFFQTSKIMRSEYAENIIDGLSDIVYNSCSVKIPFGFHYDLGDVLQFPNGQGSSTNKFCIMGLSLTYNGECVLTGIPGQKQSQSKTDKNLQGLLSTVGKNEFTSYEVRNTAPISIGDNEQKRLVFARIASNTQTKAQIHIEVNLESEAIEDYTQGVVTYLVNSEDTEFYPTETWIDGNHVLHLMYILPLEANSIQTFEVYMTSLGGTIEIDRGGVWLYASGAGLVGDAKWDGTIEILDEASEWTFSTYTFESASDSVSVLLDFEGEYLSTEDGEYLITEDGEELILEGDSE